MILTAAAFFAMAAGCAPGVDPRLLLVQAQRESGLDTNAVSPKNTDGSTDYGLMQINSGNFGLLNIRSVQEVMDPCRNLRAAADLYRTLSRYNSGNPTTSIAYAAGVMTRLANSPRPAAPAEVREITTLPAVACPVWDMWARRACEKANKE